MSINVLLLSSIALAQGEPPRLSPGPRHGGVELYASVQDSTHYGMGWGLRVGLGERWTLGGLGPVSFAVHQGPRSEVVVATPPLFSVSVKDGEATLNSLGGSLAVAWVYGDGPWTQVTTIEAGLLWTRSFGTGPVLAGSGSVFRAFGDRLTLAIHASMDRQPGRASLRVGQGISSPACPAPLVAVRLAGPVWIMFDAGLRLERDNRPESLLASGLAARW